MLFLECDLADLTPLAAQRELQSLDFLNCRVPELTPLAALPALEELAFREKTRVETLAPLARFGALRRLTIGRNVSVPRGLSPQVTTLTMDASRRTELASLAAFPRLERLDLGCPLQGESWSPLCSLVGLEGLPALEELWLHSCAALSDLGALRGATALRRLDLSRSPAPRNWSALADLPALEVLNLSGTTVDDPDLLERLPSLVALDLRGTPLASQADALRAMEASLHKRSGALYWEGDPELSQPLASFWRTFQWDLDWLTSGLAPD